MSCNGCRILRKGCSENCILRPCLQWIDTPEAQGHATVFVAKFFGRAGLMSFISNVPLPHRPALFQSLLYEAAGRTVNPVSGAAGLLWTGNWHICQAAVDTILRGGTLRPIREFLAESPPSPPTTDADDGSEVIFPPMITWQKQISPVTQDFNSGESPTPRFANSKRRRYADNHQGLNELDLGLTPPRFPHQRPGTPSTDSAATISFESAGELVDEPRLLNLFV
ncbi:hypothetical protein Cgig2_010326 [Carnegiea gigantea]|uniref:LOB domain-containing protein n=1 Tax=Carnegiea gigantea TaxID=171969 RepID=A0A9Q1QD05_9CARY|nr:hypothetical protein Cgig2_010326 [Carnegiea gigantea]